MNDERYFYRVGYSSYEESPSVILTHKRKYTSISSIIGKATLNVLNNLLHSKKRPKHYEKGEWHHLVNYRCIRRCYCKSQYDKESCKGIKDIHFSDIWRLIIDELASKNFGFELLEYTSQSFPFGWAEILSKDSWEGQRGEELEKIRNYVWRKINHEDRRSNKKT